MGPDGSFSAQKRAGSLPTTTSATQNGNLRGGRNLPVLPRGKQIKKTFNNIKITILCGFVTILVLRGTIGINLSSSEADAENQHLIEETQRILDEIRSDREPDDPIDDSSIQLVNSTYSLGPKIENWDQERKAWLEKNLGFPSYVNGKARILLVTGSPPNPCDNAIGDHYLLKAIKNKIDYCRIHGIEIMYNMAHLDKEMAGYWSKLPLMRKLMLSHPEVEWIWWMDSDAMFTDMVFELPVEKYKDHNLVIHGYPDLLFEQKSWIALNTGSFLFRNCQWSLDLLDIWAPMGPKGAIREEAGKILTANLKGRPAFEADDQSALIYLLITKKDELMDKVFVENSYYLHGYWAGLVDRYEEMMEKYHPGLGDERWPFVTHFVGCKPCGSYGDYPVEKCLKNMERAFNFADNQVLKLYGFKHRGLVSPSKLYTYQIFRGLAYMHNAPGVCHRDIKPQNVLVDPLTHQVKICDFGSAKVLIKGETNISYICSRYYRAPELIFGAMEYKTSIDIWSAGCVLAELLLGQPLFPGENAVDQLVEIIKVLGTPTREEIRCMNPNYSDFRFPQIKAHPWHKVFNKRMPPEAIDLTSRLLQYSPSLRCSALEACAHPFFDELREPNARLPNGRSFPPLFNFKQEVTGASPELVQKLVPEHAQRQTGLSGLHLGGT